MLLCTLFRLALNVSSTRLILSQGEQGLDAAGQVIEAFGSFVVQGDFLVGVIIFALIAAINFIVIAKGASRVAEVGARFHLDALPGKQLSIDADLRAGSISTEVAAERRAFLAKESHFYGSMDGAMRFVQGDAIASLVITFINAVGGLSVGMTRGLEFREAVDTVWCFDNRRWFSEYFTGSFCFCLCWDDCNECVVFYPPQSLAGNY